MDHPYYLIFITIFGFCINIAIQDEAIPNQEEILKNISSVVNVPGLDKLNASALPVEEVTKSLQKKCEKNGGADAFDRAKSAAEELSDCMKSMVNVTELQQEMDIARPTGDLDLVFKKYCRKSPIFKMCVTNFTRSIEPCLEKKERENTKIILNITQSLLNFVCYKEGDRIALFIATGGPECFKEKQSSVQTCVNNTFGGYYPMPDLESSTPMFQNLPSLLFGLKECTDIAKLQNCAVNELNNCTEPTPANIVDSLFNFIKKSTPCETLLKNVKFSAITSSTVENSSSRVYINSFQVILMTFILMRFL